MPRKVVCSLLLGIFCCIPLTTFNVSTRVVNSIYHCLSNAIHQEWYVTDNTRVVAVTSSQHQLNESQRLARSAEEDYFRFVLFSNLGESLWHRGNGFGGQRLICEIPCVVCGYEMYICILPQQFIMLIDIIFEFVMLNVALQAFELWEVKVLGFYLIAQVKMMVKYNCYLLDER